MSIFNGEDVFLETAEIPPQDAYWFGFFTLVLILFVVDYLLNPGVTSPGLIYIILSVISITFMIGAFLSDNQLFGFVMHGEAVTNTTILFHEAVGGVIGIILVGGLLGLSISYNPSPFAIATGGTLIASLIILVLISFPGVEAEEMLRASSLIPSVLRYIANETYVLALYSISIILSIVMLLFLLQFIGVYAFFIGVVLLAVQIIILYFYNPRRGIEIHPVFMHFQAIIFAALVFMILHVLAYGQGSYTTNASSYIAAFTFAVLLDSTNALLGSAIASRIAHSVNNAVLTCIALGLPLWMGGLVVLIYAGFILTVGNLDGLPGYNALVNRTPALRFLSRG